MTEPPRSPADYMTDFDVRYRVDVTLARGLNAVLPQLAEYLDMDDSRDVPKKQTHDTQHVAKQLSDDNRDVDKEEVDDSRHVLKNRAPRTIKWGDNIEVVPIASGSAPQYSGPNPQASSSTLPALEALVQATRVRVLMEEIDSRDHDTSPAVKMEVDPPLKISSRGDKGTPIDLTSSDEDSDKENDRIHPGPPWMRYD